jgi:hypothetical protein
MRIGTAVLVVLLLFTLPAMGQWREKGKVVPDTPWAKSDGDFGAMFAFTDKPEELYKAWETPGPGVQWSRTETAVRGIPIVGVIFFTGCVANAAGNCELVARFFLTTPSGKPYGNPIDADIWVGQPPPTGNALQLSHHHFGLVIDPGDELGKYSARAELTDRVSKKKMLLEQQFTAVEAPKKK